MYPLLVCPWETWLFMPIFLAEQFLFFRPGFAIETGSTLFLLIICATMLLPFFWKINDDEAGFLSLAQTLKASKECQKECADDRTALLESLEVCKHFGLNLALTQRAYLNTCGRVWLFSLSLSLSLSLSGGGKWLCHLFTNRKWVWC
jgi:hypothetical protein